MSGHFEQTFAGDVAAPQNVFKERDHVLVIFRTAKGHDQQRIITAHTLMLAGIRMSAQRRQRAVDLLGEHHPRQLVRHSHRRQ